MLTNLFRFSVLFALLAQINLWSVDATPDPVSTDDEIKRITIRCNNDEYTICYKETTACEPCGETESTMTEVDCPSEEGSSSSGESVVDNWALGYRHAVLDYSHPDAAGCGSCGGVNPSVGELTHFQLMRIHRPRQDWHRSSFGRSTFTNFDLEMRLFHNDHWDKAQMIMFFDPRSSNQWGFYDWDWHQGNSSVDGVFHDYRQTGKYAKMYDANMQFVTDIADAAFAEIVNNFGTNFLFEVVESGNASYQRGRLIAITDLNGNQTSIAYQHPRTADVNNDLNGQPALFFDIDTITDEYGKTATFHWKLVNNNRWSVIDKIEWPNGTETSYEYTSGVPYLSAVNHADGSQSTFAYSNNPVTQWREIAMDDNAGEASHIKKVVHLSQQTWVDPDTNDVINIQRNMVRKVVDGAGEDSYRNWTANDGELVRYIYEGGNRLLRLNFTPTKIIRVEYALNYIHDPNAEQPDLTTLQFVEKMNYAHTSRQQVGSTDVLGRETKLDRSLDRITGSGQINNIIHPDLTESDFEYNSNGKLTRSVDRLGRVTEHTYDASNNRLSTIRGVGTAEAATWTWTYNARGQVLSATDANGNTTDYLYDANGYLIKIIEPADLSGDPRAEVSFTYDSAGRVSSSSDALGRTTQYFYNSRNLLVETKYQDQSSELISYGTGSAATLPVSKTDRTGSVTTIAYDAELRPAVTTIAAGTPDAVSEICTYVSGTDVKASCLRNGELTEYLIDHQNRRFGVKRHTSAGNSLTSKNVYELSLDRVIFSEDPYGRRNYKVYDINDRLARSVQETVPGAITLSDINDPALREAELLALVRLAGSNAAYIITDYNYDAEGQLTSVTDANGNVDTFSYDALGRRIQSVESAGSAVAATTEWDYDAQGNVTTIRHPRHFSEAGDFITTMIYTGRNLLAARTVATGTAIEASETFSYFLDKRQATHTDYNGNILSYAWGFCCARFQAMIDPAVTLPDAAGATNPASISRHNDAGDRTHDAVVSDYDDGVFPTFSDPTNVTDIPDAVTINETTTAYDARHRPVAQTKWFAALGAVDANNPPIANRSVQPVAGATHPAADGLTTTWQYDDSLTDGVGLDVAYAAQIAGLPIGFGPDADGAAVAVTNPAGETTVIIKDAIGRTVGSIDPLGNLSTMTYDNVVAGLVETTATDPLGHTNKSQTDGAGRVIKRIDAEAYVATFNYDANGNLVSSRDANNVGQDCIFDARDRDISCTDTQGDTTTRSYNAHNAVVQQVDALGQATNCVFDARDRKVSCTDRVAATTTYAYDNNSNLISITDAEGGQTTYAYDPRNLLVTEVFPAGDAGTTQKAYGYDGAKRLVARLVNTVEAPATSETTTYAYDAINRLTTRGYPDETNADDTFAYDAASRLTSAVSNRYDNTVTRGYDADSKLITETLSIDGANYDITYGYDAADRQTSIVYPNGKIVVRDYTDRNQLAAVAYDATVLATSQYDAGMRETTRNLGNGLQTTKTYRNDNLIDAINTAGILQLSYSYDANKRKTAETDVLRPLASQSFGYDAEDRLTIWSTAGGSTAQNWNLSPIGDWDQTVRVGVDPINETRSHTNVHEVTDVNGNIKSYDFKGNLRFDRQEEKYAQAYEWDVENRLISGQFGQINKNTLSFNGSSVEASYSYDALGRRVQKDVNGTVTTFVCAGAQVVTEYENGSESQSYVYASYVDEPIALIAVGGTTSYYHANHLFSVEALTDAAGNLIETYDYDSHGAMSIANAGGAALRESSVGNAYGFTGRRLDAESGLYYFRARYFDVGLAVFIGRDPFTNSRLRPSSKDGYQDGLSLYAIVGGSPTNYVDPYGAKKCKVKSFTAPKNRSGMKLRLFLNPGQGGVINYSGGKLGEYFEMEAEFDNTAPNCCECCEFRQYVNGTFKKNGANVVHQLAGGPLHPTKPQEDGAPGPIGVPGYGPNQPGYYGHRSDPGWQGNQYSDIPNPNPHKPDPKKAQGCKYNGIDEPGITGAPGDVLEIDLTFKAEIIDTCNGNAVIDTRNWTVKGKATVPTAAQVQKMLQAQQQGGGVP